jgi:hypothetical protein
MLQFLYFRFTENVERELAKNKFMISESKELKMGQAKKESAKMLHVYVWPNSIFC